ncbi:hypothetical protein ANCDUO_15520 [Ancylostoma duodenale]|uniref:Uncharacterized protein n=1 Tax=Ancylostoma duodenale TaxID=51022 RepID=A0A0C2G0C3_9BILA|nr:hypothetical protein ANCDUO_15520 [Ancylostoma duodenale]
MEIHHSIHSHIIGKAGRGIQQAISPLVLTFDLPWIFPKEPEVTRFPSEVQLFLFFCFFALGFSLFIRGVFEKLHRLAQSFGVHLQLPEASQPVLIYGPSSGVLLVRKFIMVVLTLRAITPTLYSCVLRANAGDDLIILQAINVIMAQFHVPGLSPIVLSFDVHIGELRADIERTQKDFGVLVFSKKKNNAHDLMAVSIRSTEENMLNILRAREFLLGLTLTNYLDNEYTGLEVPQG